MKGILEEPIAMYGELGGQGHKIVVLAGSAVEVTLDTPEEHSKFVQNYKIVVRVEKEER